MNWIWITTTKALTYLDFSKKFARSLTFVLPEYKISIFTKAKHNDVTLNAVQSSEVILLKAEWVSFWKSYTDHWQLPLLQNWPLQWPPKWKCLAPPLTVHNLNRKDTNRQSHSGRPKSSRTPHNVAAVRDCCPQTRDDNERSVAINTERYVQVLGKFWTALGRWRGVVRVLQ